MKNITKKELYDFLLKAISSSPSCISLLERQPKDLCFLAIEIHGGCVIKYIKNPTKEMEKAAIKYNDNNYDNGGYIYKGAGQSGLF